MKLVPFFTRSEHEIWSVSALIISVIKKILENGDIILPCWPFWLTFDKTDTSV